MVKTNFQQSPYLRILVNGCAIPITRFITTNNDLPVNVQRYEDIERRDRICDLIDIGDDFHYLFICPYFVNERNELIPRKFTRRPNLLTFQQLMNCEDKKSLLKLKHFIGLITKALR